MELIPNKWPEEMYLTYAWNFDVFEFKLDAESNEENDTPQIIKTPIFP